MKFYYAPICPFAHRANIILHELNIPHDKISIDLDNKPAWYAESINPDGTVPAIILDNGTTISESLICCDYLISTYGKGSELDVEDALTRAQTQYFVASLDNQFLPPFYSLLRPNPADKQKELGEKLMGAVRRLTALLERQSDGPYFLGERFSMADVGAIPWMARMAALRHYRGFEVPRTNEFERYHAWAEAVLKRQSLVETGISEEECVRGYTTYANGSR